MISNQPRATRLTNLKFLAQLQPLFYPFSNNFSSLQSVWLSAVQFFHKLHQFMLLVAFFPSFAKTWRLIKLQDLLKEINQIARKWEKTFATFINQHNILDQYNIRREWNYLVLRRWILLFQNRWNKVLIKLGVLQFRYEIILVISMKLALRVYEITGMISDQTALHSVQ